MFSDMDDCALKKFLILQSTGGKNKLILPIGSIRFAYGDCEASTVVTTNGEFAVSHSIDFLAEALASARSSVFPILAQIVDSGSQS